MQPLCRRNCLAARGPGAHRSAAFSALLKWVGLWQCIIAKPSFCSFSSTAGSILLHVLTYITFTAVEVLDLCLLVASNGNYSDAHNVKPTVTQGEVLDLSLLPLGQGKEGSTQAAVLTLHKEKMMVILMQLHNSILEDGNKN